MLQLPITNLKSFKIVNVVKLVGLKNISDKIRANNKAIQITKIFTYK